MNRESIAINNATVKDSYPAPNGKWLTREQLEELYFRAQNSDIYTQLDLLFEAE